MYRPRRLELHRAVDDRTNRSVQCNTFRQRGHRTAQAQRGDRPRKRLLRAALSAWKRRPAVVSDAQLDVRPSVGRRRAEAFLRPDVHPLFSRRSNELLLLGHRNGVNSSSVLRNSVPSRSTGHRSSAHSQLHAVRRPENVAAAVAMMQNHASDDASRHQETASTIYSASSLSPSRPASLVSSQATYATHIAENRARPIRIKGKISLMRTC